MGISAEHVADVLAYLGDMSGSGIDEVGIAMTKASSAAMEFGLSLEWLGAYIATVAEKTRQAPEVIGTSINTILARLHNIKEKGFNEEDATQINDVAKALASLEQPIKLIDEQTGNWRDMSVIMQEIAAQWEGLTGKQKAYIATTLAGTRQQNTFLALMNDMAKGAEGGSRTFELYAGAMNAAGTSAAKYAIWQESVAAAQGKLTSAMQSMYALLDAEWMKGVYNGLASIVETFTAGSEAMNGWNLKLPLIAAGLGAVVIVTLKIVAAVRALQAAAAAGGLLSALSGGTLGLIAAGIAGVVAVVTLLTGAMSKAFEPVDYSEQINKLTDRRDSLRGLADEYQTLAAKQHKTGEESARMNAILETLAGSSLTLRDALTDATGGFVNQTQVLKTLNEHLAETETRLNNLKRQQASGAFKDLGGLKEAQNNVSYAKSREDAWREYQKWTEKRTPGGFADYADSMTWFAPKDQREYWNGIYQVTREMEKEIGHWWGYTVEEVSTWFENAGLSAQESTQNAIDALNEMWQTYYDHLSSFATGPQYMEMNPYFQGQMDRFFQDVIDGIDKEGEITEQAMTGYAARIKNKQDELFKLFSEDQSLTALLDQREAMLKTLDVDGLDAYNDMVGKINAILEVYNADRSDADKLDLLPEITPESLRRMREANAELTRLSDALATRFDTMKRQREAEAAEKTLYADQIKQLKEAWQSDETGAAFIQILNEMQAANGDLVSGLFKTHEGLLDLAAGADFADLEDSAASAERYAQGLDALTQMERAATQQAQKRTGKMLEEAEATKALEAAQKEHYLSLLGQLRDAYRDTGYEAFVTMWDELGDKTKEDPIALYPEVAALATVTGEAADGAAVFAQALEKAANMDFSAFTKAMGKDYAERVKADQAAASKDNGFTGELKLLENALKNGGVEGMRNALFGLYESNEGLYQSLMETYRVLGKLGDESLNDAQAADALSQAYLTQADASAKAAQMLREQTEREAELEAASKHYYRETLEKLRGAYQTDGTKGFHEAWDSLDDTARKYILKTYGAVGDLAVEAVERGRDVVDGIFEQAIADAIGMKETLLKQTLTEGAADYALKLPVDKAKENGFLDQLTQLREALADGTFMDVLAGFGQEMTDALLSEHAWLNEIIGMLADAKDGTYTLTDATALLSEHIAGTQEHFEASIGALIDANSQALDSEEEHIAMLESLIALLEQDGGVEAFAEAFSILDEKMRKALFDKSPALKKFFEDWVRGSADAKGAAKDLRAEVDKLNLQKLQKDSKVWNSLSGAMDKAAKGGKEFSQAYGAVVADVENLSQAMGALEFIQSKGKKKADDLTDAYNVLASYTGVSADQLRTNLDPAVWAIAGDMDMAAGSAEYLTNWLFNAAGVQFSAGNWQVQLAALSNSADTTIANIARLVQTMLECAGATLSLDGNTVKVNWGSKGSYTPPSARKSGGGGGGSRNSGSTGNTMSEIERMLDLMKQNVDIQNHRREMAQLAQDYHEARGEIQGVILYLEKEMAAVRGNSATLEGYLTQIEAQIEAKRREVASMSTSAAGYEQAAKDLEALQDLHRDYSAQLIQNKTDLEKLQQAIKAQQDAIRDMEIDLRNTIRDAILDREALNERMLQGTIKVEQAIIDVVTQRYEKERDELLRLAEEKKRALEEEMRLLDEQLAKRKKLEEEEDRLKKLKQLEEQLARITMDPTRQKEALALREEIAKLRKDIAWGMAEDEVAAQKDALQKQIDSVDEYIEYVTGYYEELLANPRKLIEEMSELMRRTDEEIIEWLKENHAEYADMTDAMRQDMVNGWQEMLDDMHGAITTYWDEVEAIIAQGDDAIIAFLMEHSADYKEAGKLQAEAYVDQWKQKLEDLRNAYKAVADEIASFNYTPVAPSTGSGSSSGSGGGSSAPKVQYKFVAAGKTYGPYASIAAAEAAKTAEINKIKAGATSGSSMYGQAIAAIQQAEIVKYAKGGLNTKTGLAWLDGTPGQPERVLSPYQTALFEDMLASLHEIRIKAPSMPGIPYTQKEPERAFHIETIQVTVEKLEQDADYEEMARKVGTYIYEEVTRGTPVGGLRYGR